MNDVFLRQFKVGLMLMAGLIPNFPDGLSKMDGGTPSWVCKCCYASNPGDADKCKSCGSSKPA